MSGMNVSLLIEFLTRGADKVRGELAGIRSGAKDLRDGFAGAVRQGFSVENIERATRNAERKLTEARGRLRGAMGSALALGAPVWTAGNFETGMAGVATLIDTAAESMEEMGAKVLRIADRTPVMLGDLTDALYDVRSAGIAAGDAMAVLEGSARLGVAGKGTTKEAVDLVTSSINAFDLQGERQARIYDTIFKAVKNGKTTISELSQGFGAVAGTVANAGVEIDEYMASVAALTTTGMPAVQAHTQIRAAISGLTRETKESSKLFGGLGAKNFKDLVEQSGGMVQAVARIREALGGDDAAILKVLGSVEALNAVLGLTGEQAGIFQATLTDMRDGLDAVDDAFEKQARTFNNELRVMRNQMQGLAISFGTHLLAPLKSLISTIRPLVGAIADWMQANPELTRSIVQAVAAILAMNVAIRLASYAVAAIRLPLIGLAKSFLLFDEAGRNVSIAARAVRALGAAGSGLGRLAAMAGGTLAAAFAGLKVAAAGALGAIAAAGWPVIAVLAAIVAAAFAVWKYWDRLKAAVGGFFEGLAGAFAPQIEAVRKTWSDFVDGVAKSAGDIAATIGIDVDAIGAALARARQAVADFFAGLFSAETLSEEDAAAIAETGRRIGEWIGQGILAVLKGVAGLGEAIVDALIKGLDAAWGRVTAWFGQAIAELKGLFDFDISFTWPEPPERLLKLMNWFGLGGAGEPAPVAASPFPQTGTDPIAALESFARERGADDARITKTIAAEVVDKRPPQVTVNLSQSISGVVDPVAAANAANRGVEAAVRRAKTGALHGGTE